MPYLNDITLMGFDYQINNRYFCLIARKPKKTYLHIPIRFLL